MVIDRNFSRTSLRGQSLPGLLEHQALLLAIHDGQQGSVTNECVGPILDPDTLRSLGHVRVAPPPWPWFPQVGLPSLRVCEGEDDSLVFTLERLWPVPLWIVRDADGKRVGHLHWVPAMRLRFRAASGRTATAVRGTAIESTSAVDSSTRNGLRHRFANRDGQDWGNLRRCDDGWRLEFGAELQDEPFGKMLVLAAALVLTA
jgi:hypothetical protein